MATINSQFSRIVGRRATPDIFEQDGGLCMYTYNVAATDVFGANDILNMGSLPAGMVPVGMFLAFVRSGTDATAVAQVGILNAGLTDIDVTASSGGATWGSTVAGDSSRVVNGVALTQPNAAFYNVQSQETHRDIGIKWTGAVATPANLQKIILGVFVKPYTPYM